MKKKTRRGIVIIIVLLVMAILATIGFALATLGSNNILQAGKELDSWQALYAAEAGARRKIGEIRGNDTANIASTSMPTLTDCSYEVSVTPSGSTAPNGFVVPGTDTFYILSTGRSRAETLRQVGMLVRKSGSAFGFAAFAADGFDIKNGCYTDTWDSLGLPLDHSLANIGTNSLAAGSVSIEAGARIGKDGSNALARIAGPPGSTAASLIGGGAAEGSEYAAFQVLSSPMALPPVVSPRLGPGSTVNVDGATAVLPIPPGDYEVVSIKNGGKLILDVSSFPNNTEQNFCFKQFKMENPGSSLELVTGGLNITCNLICDEEFLSENGSLINPTGNPANLQFKVVNGNAKVENFGSARFVVYNPAGEVSVKGAELFGAVTARKIVMDESGGTPGIIHYDQQLGSTSTPGFSAVQVVSTQRF